MTDEQRESLIEALLRERRHYEIHGPKDRVGQVNEQLSRLGYDAKPPAKRAERAVRPKGQRL